MSLPIKDKVLNHYVTRFILIPKLEKYLDIRNAATRKGMGTEYARKLFRKYLVLNKSKKFYILKLDISKYFYSINHEVLKSLLKDKLNSMEYSLVCDIIDSSNRKYVNDRISLLERKYGIELPRYKYGKGLPIGYRNYNIMQTVIMKLCFLFYINWIIKLFMTIILSVM